MVSLAKLVNLHERKHIRRSRAKDRRQFIKRKLHKLKAVLVLLIQNSSDRVECHMKPTHERFARVFAFPVDQPRPRRKQPRPPTSGPTILLTHDIRDPRLYNNSFSAHAIPVL